MVGTLNHLFVPRRNNRRESEPRDSYKFSALLGVSPFRKHLSASLTGDFTPKLSDRLREIVQYTPHRRIYLFCACFIWSSRASKRCVRTEFVLDGEVWDLLPLKVMKFFERPKRDQHQARSIDNGDCFGSLGSDLIVVAKRSRGLKMGQEWWAVVIACVVR